MKHQLRPRTRRRLVRTRPNSHRLEDLFGFSYLRPEMRDGLRLLAYNDLFWEYVDQLRVLEEKKVAIQQYMNAIVKRVQKEMNKKGEKA